MAWAEVVKCLCGCGEEIEDKPWHPRYKKNHNFKNRIPLNKGLTKETSDIIKNNCEKVSIKTKSIKRKPLSEKHKQSLFTSHMGQVAWNSGLTSEDDERILSGKNHPLYGKHFSEESKEKMKRSHRGQIPSPNIGFGRRIKYLSPFQGKICFRSSYEYKYALYLDSINEPWYYEIKTFDLGDVTYTPDFYLFEKNEYVEIKGYMKPISQNKINKFKEMYPNEILKILFKEDLISMGIDLTLDKKRN